MNFSRPKGSGTAPACLASISAMMVQKESIRSCGHGFYAGQEMSALQLSNENLRKYLVYLKNLLSGHKGRAPLFLNILYPCKQPLKMFSSLCHHENEYSQFWQATSLLSFSKFLFIKNNLFSLLVCIYLSWEMMNIMSYIYGHSIVSIKVVHSPLPILSIFKVVIVHFINIYHGLC